MLYFGHCVILLSIFLMLAGENGYVPDFYAFFAMAAILLFWSILWWMLFIQKLGRRHFLFFFLPVSYIAMEFVNFGLPDRAYFCKQVYYFHLFGTWMLLLEILISDLLAGTMDSGWKKFVSGLWQTMVQLLFLIPLLVIFNRAVLGQPRLDRDAMFAVCQTNFREAAYYFFDHNHGAVLCVLLPAVTYGCFLLWRMRVNYLQTHQKSNTFRNRKEKISAILYVVLLCSFMVFVKQMTNWEPKKDLMTASAAQMPLDYQMDAMRYKELHPQVLQKIEMLTDRNEGRGQDGVFVLVIGESVNRNIMSSYGYERADTTPFQRSLRNDGNTVFFERAYSCHVQTFRVLQLLLTERNQYNTDLQNNEIPVLPGAVSLLDYAKSAGYQTWWLSNQKEKIPDYSAVSMLTDSADHVEYIEKNLVRRGQHSYDEDLLKYLPEKLGNRELIVLHLMGSHMPYDVFLPPDYLPEGCEFFNDYELSIRYNDDFLRSLLNQLGEQADVVMYVPDHSEGVSMQRSHDPRPEMFLSEMTEIPMWIHVSEKYRTEHEQFFLLLKEAARNKVFTNDLVFNLMLKLMGVNNILTPEVFDPVSGGYIVSESTARSLYGRMRLDFTPYRTRLRDARMGKPH